MTVTTITLNLAYSFRIDPKATRQSPNYQTYYETNTGLWKPHWNDLTGDSYKVMDNLSKLKSVCDEINSVQSLVNYIEVVPPSLNNHRIIVHIHGEESFITKSRTKMLHSYNYVSSKTVVLDESQYMKIDEQFIKQMNALCQRYQVEVIINNEKSSFSKKVSEIAYSIHIVGHQDNITFFDTSLKVLIDSHLNNYTIDSYSLPLSLIPLAGGVNLSNFKQIAKQTNVNIYIPDLLPNIFNSNVLTSNFDMTVWITAQHPMDLILTRSILDKIFYKRSQLISKRIAMSQSKLDLILLHNQQDMIDLMLKHGVFIQLPSLGEANQSIIIQGLHTDAIDECIRDIGSIVTQYYSVSGIYANKDEILQLCQYTKTCTAEFTGYSFEINGQRKEIKSLVHQLSVLASTLNVRIEVNNDQKDFISGKKNGKLVKILNQVNNIPSIKFNVYNEYRFYIDIESSSSIISQVIDLIELELPSELKFNIPEVFHKSIIGNGGSMIQSIMKKHNVFIKFSSNFDTSTNVYSLSRQSNVLIKCPQKNMASIPLVKQEIDDLVLKYCMNDVQQQNVSIYYNLKFQILKSQYLMLVNNNKLHLINQFEHDHNSFIDFPISIDAFKNSNVVEFNIKGSESKIKSCAKQLQTVLPSTYEFKFAGNSAKFDQVFKTTRAFQNEVVIPFKIMFGFDVIVNDTPLNSDLPYYQIVMSYYCDLKLSEAIESMTFWLRECGFLIYEKTEMKFNSILESSLSSPIKLHRFSNQIPLQSITNVNINMMTPTSSPLRKLQPSTPSITASSPIKSFMVSPSRQQLMMSSPIRNNMYSPVIGPQSPTKQQRQAQSPVRNRMNQQQQIRLSPVKFNLEPTLDNNNYVYNV
ncbi:KH domain family protein [Candida parapsilosis]|uniref:K Homology domain-containing protein n=2 Tax=Candida parapsilosis TaxID=5480 RepID=G8BAV9_CANPC|nr:uncharacterized protein CPAR2_807320 [Candida parapsilosis]KAF6052079.1 KH domain family protein [Candida parapsilosis]KAF6052424.1 KH domain family protein [Candida parapsilosis]KAF6053881.1 KH domain family protein [Candida parapsilosis]KAF6064200.1 KH domain family protein [Candida parapsilosis]KAI5906690.1 KH domain-containing protein [Candida parapsilosis]